MSHYVGRQKTSRHGIPFDSIPTRKGSVYGGSLDCYTQEDYGAILDCVCEMTDMVATSNGWTLEKSIARVLTDEGWRILPSHQKLIIALLTH